MSPDPLENVLSTYDEVELRALALRPNPPPQAGTWILKAPDGTEISAESPLACCAAELRERVSPLVALARLKVQLLDEAEERRKRAFDTLPDDYEAPH
jgi:hypothetical protein